MNFIKLIIRLFFLVGICGSLVVQAQGAPRGYIENPTSESYQSGVGIISGFHCDASRVSIRLDGRDIGFSFVGTERADTASLCGKVSTGFSFLINYNSLEPGFHTIELLDDLGVFAVSTFSTTRSGGTEFLKGVEQKVFINRFPDKDSSVTLHWIESKQAFVVTGVSGPAFDEPVRPPTESEIVFLSQTIVDVLPQYLKYPLTFELISPPVLTYPYLGNLKKGQFTVKFSGKNAFGVPSLITGYCPIEWAPGGFWRNTLSPVNLTICTIFD